jgi:hypothetical protein
MLLLYGVQNIMSWFGGADKPVQNKPIYMYLQCMVPTVLKR